MLFNKNDDRVNERILYQTKPNMILGCKKAIFGVILLGVVLFVSPMIIKFIGEMQVYMISYVKLSLTRYSAIALFVVILIIVLYIIWQLIAWHSIEYTLTDSRIIVKSGVLSTKKTYMPYSTIQDVNTSQSILAKLFNVGSVSVFSAYDNNLMELSNISNPSKAEEIIFSHIVGPRNFQTHVPRYNQPSIPQERGYFDEDDEYLGRNEYYDDFDVITPITHEKYANQRREYDYYPENLSFDESPVHNYEYEPYDNGFGRDIKTQNQYPQDSYYNEVRDEYSYGNDDYYHNNSSQNQYDGSYGEVSKNDAANVDDIEDSPQKVIRRHFDKFKK